MNGTFSARHARLAAIPHKQASEVRFVDVPPQNGLIGYLDARATTACGEDLPTTLTTRNDDRVRCEACRAAMSESTEG